ncbi:hypothetical protein Hanom_Chr03g00237791 [Helianthus anomalus]
MSGEGSSRGARGRKPGPVARPRGSPTQEKPVVYQRPGRRIRYEGPEQKIYGRRSVRREHLLLKF